MQIRTHSIIFSLVVIFLCTACGNQTQDTAKGQLLKPILGASSTLSDADKLKSILDAEKLDAYGVYKSLKGQDLDYTVLSRFVRAIYVDVNREYERKHKLEWYLSRLPLVEFATVLYYLKENNHKTFMDIGSGNGDKLFMALLMGFDKVYGVEYETKLHTSAMQALKSLVDNKVCDLREGDATKLGDEYYAQADFIYMYCPLILNKPVQAKLMLRLIKNMRDNTMIYEAGFVYPKELSELIKTKFDDGYRGFLAVKKENGKYYYRYFISQWEELQL
ncbi:MAG TPA: hypothetical protein DCM08_09925 [Microscillaceae bacterium]|jgi:hypothetical protein|nr:hypothetical protein [Microscillaceae bacterium]